MKIIIILSFAILVGCQAVSDEDDVKQWNEFQVEFEKNYRSPSETRKRSNIFRRNLEEIEAHNALYKQGLVSYEKGVTRFTDWSEEERLQYVNRFIKPRKIASEIFKANSTISVPQTIDWRDFGAVRGVKDQGSCASCWTFSATGGMEGQAFLQKGLNVSLSEQYLINCANETYGSYGCRGGYIENAFSYVSEYGIDTEENQPYQGVQGTCKPAPNGSFKIGSYVGVPSDEASLKEAVGTVGPITAVIEITQNFMDYKSGIFFDPSCSNMLNHAVLVVGYGKENEQEFWIIKNSFGTSWGERGYIRLARNRGSNCGISNWASYPTL